MFTRVSLRVPCVGAPVYLPQELFTSLMAKESFSVAQSQNRRLLKLQDITDIMHNQVIRRLGLGNMLRMCATQCFAKTVVAPP